MATRGRVERFRKTFRGADCAEALRGAIVRQAVNDLRRKKLRADALTFLVDGAAATWGLEAWPILNKCLEVGMINSDEVVEALARAAWQRLETQLAPVAEMVEALEEARQAIRRLRAEVDDLRAARAMEAEMDGLRAGATAGSNGKARCAMKIRVVLKSEKDAERAKAFSALRMAERGASVLRGTAPEVRRPATLAEIGAATLRERPEKARREPERPAQWSPHGRPLTLGERMALQNDAVGKLADAYRELVEGYGYKPNG